jgi:hypothetical protein
MRFLPLAPNAAPVAAIALFSGAYLNKKIGPWVPLLIMAVTDLFIGSHGIMFFTWGAFLIIGLSGVYLKKSRTPAVMIGSTVAASILFFIISNAGVWLYWYPKTLAGLTDCFIKAIPFFRTSLLSNLIFAFIFTGAYEFSKEHIKEDKLKHILLGTG